MHTEDYIREKTGLLLVDPSNDFLSPAGKLWPHAKEVAEEVNFSTRHYKRTAVSNAGATSEASTCGPR